MTKLTSILASGAAIIALTGIASANPQADINQDGQITQSEYMAQAQTRFESTDLNQDGYLSEEERKQARQQRMSDRRSDFFAKADTDGDGSISPEEHAALSGPRGPKSSGVDGERRDKKGKRGGKRGKGKAERMAEIDTNGDGLLSYQEYMTSAEQRFAKADANGDGIIGPDEGRRGKKG